MAKKKSTHHHVENKPPQTQEQQHANQSPKDMDAAAAASGKLENLRFLNSKLLNEAVVRRQLVESALNAKESLESELTRSEMEKEALQAELTRVQDRADQLELESQVVSAFASEQVSQKAEVFAEARSGYQSEIRGLQRSLKIWEMEMLAVKKEKREIEKVKIKKESEIVSLEGKLRDLVAEIENERDGSIRLGRERDALRAELDLQIEEANGLRAKHVEAEKREIAFGQEVQKLKMDYHGATDELEEKLRTIASTKRDKQAVERSLAESNLVVEELKRGIEEIAREKKWIEEERNAEVKKRKELEFAVAALNDMVLCLQSKEQWLRADVADLEKRCAEVVEKEKEMSKEIDTLVEEKKDRERSFERLVEEKGLVQKHLDVTLKDLDEQQQKTDVIVMKKRELEEVIVRRESEIVEIQREVSELRNALSTLTASCKDQTKKNVQLQSEVHQYKDAISQVSVERDDARKGFDKERETGVILREKILGMEKKIEEIQKMAAEKEAANLNVLGEKKELESQCQILMKERASLENKILKAEKQVDDIQAKLELADANSDLLMNMLRDTGRMICLDEDGGLIEDGKVVDSVKPFVEELEAIKAAFKNREVKVEDMKKQLEFLQSSVAEAKKRKSFWTLVSSATTIFAAASVAYIARGR